MKVNLSSVDKRLTQLEKKKQTVSLGLKIEEMKAITDKWREEYNSPEAEAERKAQYEYRGKIGKLRHEAKVRGEDPEYYPFPEDTVESLEESLRESEKSVEVFGDNFMWGDFFKKDVEKIKKRLDERLEWEKSHPDYKPVPR